MASVAEKKILVVDDEPDVRNFLSACIEDAGFQVETAVDGADALEKIKAGPPDLMTLDMVMPRKSGIQLMRELKKDERFSAIPVIVITAHARDDLGSDDIQEFQAFAARYRPKYTLEKPITPSSLIKAISEILQVEIETREKPESSELEEVKSMLNKCDPEMFSKIKEMLKKKD